MTSFTTSVRVRYADTDQMGIVNNGRYLEYFEVGRTELFRSMGLSYSAFEHMGYGLPLIEAHCEFLRPALYDDILLIASRIGEFGGARLRIDYTIHRSGDPSLLARGHTIHAFTCIPSGKPVRPPVSFLETLRRAEQE
jgi:acyl-CoA thioester hydrolase